MAGSFSHFLGTPIRLRGSLGRAAGWRERRL